MSVSHQLTPGEARSRFLHTVKALAAYWSIAAQSDREKLDGLAWSILGLFDGQDLQLPAFDLVARPTSEDTAYWQASEEGWVKDGTVINQDCSLQEEYTLIGKPAQKPVPPQGNEPWIALGLSRSTYYRRKAKAGKGKK